MSGQTHITVILDRTGSMQPIRDDIIGGFNAFLHDQRDAGGEATLTLVQFDSQDPFEVVHDFLPLKSAPDLTPETYVPRASTPLLDALGRGINHLQESLWSFPEDGRPEKVLMLVITDGLENASREFSLDHVRKMIADRTSDGWSFVFLSADLEAISEACRLGFEPEAVMGFDRYGQGFGNAMACVSTGLRRVRGNKASSVRFDTADRAGQDIEKGRSGGK
jgi:hypothetical protein